MTFAPQFNILPASQLALWKELMATPKHFVLYGPTALALILGHRVSEDFNFFANSAVDHRFSPGYTLPGANGIPICGRSEGVLP